MLLILFEIKKELYAIAGHQIVEVVPFLLPQKMPSSPNYVIGLINYRGVHVPVMDLSSFMTNKPCRQRLSTRIILLNYPEQPHKTENQKIIGLLAENITETVRTPADWQPEDDKNEDKLYIAPEITGHKMVQWFDPYQFLAKHASLKDVLL